MHIPFSQFLYRKLTKYKKVPDTLKSSKIESLLVSPGSGSAKWTDHDYENFAEETYLKNVIAFRCIDEIGTAVSSVPWTIYERKSSRQRAETREHPLSQLIRHPNPQESFSYLMLKNACYFVMDGNSYMERVRVLNGPNKDTPMELYVHRPDRINIEVDSRTGRISGYTYTVEGRSKTWNVDVLTGQCDLWHFKAFHPTNDWYGASVTEPTSREIDTSNEATEWNKKMLENEGRPGMVITFIGQNLSDERYEKLENMLNEKHSGGAKNAGRNLILEGEKGTDAKPYGWTPKDMDFIEGNRELARRIALGFRIPPMLLGIPGDLTHCLPEYTKITTKDGYVDIKDIKVGDLVWSIDYKSSSYKIMELKKVLHFEQTGTKKVYRIYTNYGEYIDATDNHPFIVAKGSKGVKINGVMQYYHKSIPLSELKVGDSLLVQDCFPATVFETNTFVVETDNETKVEKIQGNADECCSYDKIISIEELGDLPVYDIEVEDNHNFFANNICVHNSNYEEARQAFWEESIYFYLRLFRDELNNWFFGRDDRFAIDYVLDDIPALSPKRHRLWERAEKSDFITINEKREMVGKPPVKGGDVILVPANMIPLDMLTELPSSNNGNNQNQREDALISKLIDEGHSKEDALKFLGLV